MQLIKIDSTTIGQDVKETVNARELHTFLGVKQDFSHWIKAQIKRARIFEGSDFLTLTQKDERQILVEYHLTIEAGKHIAMISGTDKGFEVRDYFIECEKRAIAPVSIPQDPILALVQAVQMSREKVLSLESGQHVLAVGLSETRLEVNSLKQNLRLENWQQMNILRAVNHKVELWRELYPNLNIRKAYPAIWRHIKDKFNVPRYNEIPAIEYDRALSLVQKLNLSNLAGL